jgi:alanine racemase
MDSGMHRVGLPPGDQQAVYQRLQPVGKVAKSVLMSHFARADGIARVAEQLAVYSKARQGV